ncbi:MAG: histone [Candidatus Aenigmatarchaeota archaeon]
MLPLLPFERIAKKNGVKRLSKEALEEIRDIIEELAVHMSEKAVGISKHAKRNTVKEEDIKFVTH